MKTACAVTATLALGIFLGSAAVARTPQQGQNDPRYLTVRFPAEIVDIEFDASLKGQKSRRTMSPLDSLAHDGWRLVAAVKDDARGGGFVCFFTNK